jgi:hypothetical protein
MKEKNTKERVQGVLSHTKHLAQQILGAKSKMEIKNVKTQQGVVADQE